MSRDGAASWACVEQTDVALTALVLSLSRSFILLSVLSLPFSLACLALLFLLPFLFFFSFAHAHTHKPQEEDPYYTYALSLSSATNIHALIKQQGIPTKRTHALTMDNSDDVGYSSVAWDTYSPDDDSHRNHHSGNNTADKNRLQSSNTLHSSLFASSDEEDNNHHNHIDNDDDDDDLADITAAASSAILPAETSAWADEPLDNEVIDIHSTNGHHNEASSNPYSTTRANNGSSNSNNGRSIHIDSDIRRNHSYDDVDEEEGHTSQQVHRVSWSS